jgi:hypothetical protein
MSLVIGGATLGAQNITTHADVAISGGAGAAKLLDKNAGRATVFIYNLGSATARVGDANTATAQGVPLPASTGLTIETTDAIYAYADSSTTLALVETVRP